MATAGRLPPETTPPAGARAFRTTLSAANLLRTALACAQFQSPIRRLTLLWCTGPSPPPADDAPRRRLHSRQPRHCTRGNASRLGPVGDVRRTVALGWNTARKSVRNQTLASHPESRRGSGAGLGKHRKLSERDGVDPLRIVRTPQSRERASVLASHDGNGLPDNGAVTNETSRGDRWTLTRALQR
jgi:hypothetical protein